MLIVLDPALTQGPSHHFGAFLRIAAAMAEVGVPVVALAHVGCGAEGLPDGVRIVRTFDQNPYDCSSQSPDVAAKAKAFFGGDATRYTVKTVSALKGIGAGADDVLLIPTANAPEFAMMANFAERDFGIKLRRVHIVTPYDSATMFLNDIGTPIQRSVARLKSNGVVQKTVFLHGENPRLAGKLKSEFGVEVTGLCAPFRAPAVPPIRSDGKLRVAMFGAARIEKGFGTINEFVDILAESGEADSSFDLAVYCPPPSRGYEPRIEEVVYELKNRDYGFLRVIDRALSLDEYYGALYETDAVFMPYNPARYAFRGSSTAMEAAHAGKLIIATRNSYPATLSVSPWLLSGTGPREFASIFWRACMMREQLLGRAAKANPLNALTPVQFAQRLRLNGAQK